jgi:hypothetical protein
MKLQSLLVRISLGTVLAFFLCGMGGSRAAAATPAWEQAKIDKLEHACHLLQHADVDYKGHRAEAVIAIKKAAKILGVEFHEKVHPGETQWLSDRRLREAKRLLQDLVVEGKGAEQPHIQRAIKEIDKALEVK